MEALKKDFSKLDKNTGLAASIEDVQKLQDLLVSARDAIIAGEVTAPIALAKLQNPVKTGFEDLNSNLKKIHKALGDYGKSLDKFFKDKTLPTVPTDALDSDNIDHAIGVHLLREGNMQIAGIYEDDLKRVNEEIELFPEFLSEDFGKLHFILDEMKDRNLQPAIDWAREHRQALEGRGSNVEFEICRLHFVWLFMDDLPDSIGTALMHARREFGQFQARYLEEIQHLAAAMAYNTNLGDSPYKRLFYSESAWEDLAQSFTKEFCALLNLPADSPLVTAISAGAVALPILQKLQAIMEKKRTEWTTDNELPVEIPLPRSYRFHSIFVCPVSKAQTSSENPPMMMPCGHVIARESLEMISKSGRLKCPYCPTESRVSEARQVIL